MSALPEPIDMRVAARAPGLRRPWRGRPAVWLGALVCLALLMAALAPWTLSRGALREEVAAQLRSAAGLYVFPRGAARISLLPRPRIKFEDVAFVDPNGALVIEAQSMSGDIRLLPLLGGRLEVAEIALKSPRITIDLDRAPMSSAGAAVRAASAPAGSPQAAKADAARLGILDIADGTADLRRKGVTVGMVTHIDARLDWRSVAAPAALKGSLDWAGQRQQVTLWISAPATLLRGGNSPLTLELQTPDTSVTSSGTANMADRARFEGRVRVATRRAPTPLASLGIDLQLPPDLREVILESDVVAGPGAVTLGNLRLDIGTDQFEGALAWQAGGERPSLTGTLAARNLSLTPYLAVLSSPAGQSTSQTGIGVDLDLRVSANRLRYDRLQLDDAALSVRSQAGRVEVALADATAYGGQIKGRAMLAPANAESRRSQVQASLLMRGIDWGALERDFTGQGRVTGTADVSLALHGDVDATQPTSGGLNGDGRISLSNGEITGLDVVGALARLETRPLAAASDLASGRTRFERATMPFTIDGGLAKVDEGNVVGSTYAMSVAGTLQMGDGQTAMSANVRPATQGTEATSPEAAGFGFEITGPWRRPQITPDVQGLIRRSGAASPLFGRPADAAH